MLTEHPSPLIARPPASHPVWLGWLGMGTAPPQSYRLPQSLANTPSVVANIPSPPLPFPQAGPTWPRYFTAGGIVCAFFSTFFAHGFLRLARKLAAGEAVAPGWIGSGLLRNNQLNVLGIAITVVGLQASVGEWRDGGEREGERKRRGRGRAVGWEEQDPCGHRGGPAGVSG